MSSEFEITRRYFLAVFAYEHYGEAINEVRSNIEKNLLSREQWQQIREWIANSIFEQGEPLRIVHDGANQVLDENSDEEAYKWLDLVMKNVERTDRIVEEY